MKTRFVMMSLVGVLAFTFAMGNASLAQDDHPCVKPQSNFSIRYNSGDYVGAYPFWQKLMKICAEEEYKCPCLNKDIWGAGTFTMSTLIDTFPDKKQNLLDTIIISYDAMMTNLGRTAPLLAEYGLELGSVAEAQYPQKIYDLLKEALEKHKEDQSIDSESLAYAIEYFFRSAYTLARMDKEKGCKWLVGEYFYTVEYIEWVVKNGGDAEYYGEMQGRIDQLAEGCLTCDELLPIVDKAIANMPESCDERVAIIDKYLGLLSKKKCTDSDQYAQLAVMSYECNPSCAAAEALGDKEWNNGDKTKAMNYYKEALELCEEAGEGNLGEIKHKMAKLAKGQGNCSLAMQYARQAAAAGIASANTIIAQCIIQNTTCGNTDIDRRSVYWLASDYMGKAGGDPDHYKSKFPTTTALFDKGIAEGSSYTVKCFGETTTVRAGGGQ